MSEQFRSCLANAGAYAPDLPVAIRDVELIVEGGEPIEDIGVSLVVKA